MDVSVTRHVVNDGVFRLAVAGEIDMATCDTLAAAIHDAVIADRAAELIVDLGGVTFLDSTGISVLVMGSHLAAKCGCAYTVVSARDSVRGVLEITGVWEGLAALAPPSAASATRLRREP